MNNGKICVSVCAKTADELIEQIKYAENLADVIEIRFDCLEEEEFDCLDLKKTENILSKIFENKYSKPILQTFRLKEQGGKRKISPLERENFWNMGYEVNWADCEEDYIENSFYWLWEKRICSHHDFESVPNDLIEIYERLKATNADIIKIAVQTDDIADTIPIWQLLKRAKSENKEIIPIAMGESGKWTRILGLAHGAFMTYASLDSDKETAPGQVTVKDLQELYRAKELDENTEIYGILGNNTSVSISPYIHNTAFKFHNLNAVFVPLQTHNLDEFIRRMVKPETREIELNFKGFAVTIPHKQTIIKHLDFIDETAEKIGAVNTVKIIDGKLYGYNTDAKGFIEPLKQVYGDLNSAKVAVLGAGGASRACVYALQKEGAEVTVYGRDEINQIKNQKSKIEKFDIIVNATPLGMRGKFEGESPLSAEQIKDANLVYDLVYVPFQTAFLAEADKVDVPKIGGMAMLVAQAIEQQKIWTGLDTPIVEIGKRALEKL
jgi:3-dehydroquinate dehydratase / shikimate dehydrogenase